MRLKSQLQAARDSGLYRDLSRILAAHKYFIGKAKGPTILDIGCGHGFLVGAAAQNGFSGGAYGIDGGGGSPSQWPSQMAKPIDRTCIRTNH